MAQTAGRIEPVDIEEEVRRSYLDYAMSVIVGRALPDVRDGLKPVHRRILWSMLESGLRPDRPYRKCAAAVGEVMKKYHPHGDVAIYDALVRMAQDFSLRYPLIDGHGNFGSVDGDPPAAQRYCVTGETLVRTAEGATVRIADLVPGAAPNSDSEIDVKLVGRLGEPVRATTFFHSGRHRTLRVTTREGYRLTGTPDHPILCLLPVMGVPMLLWKLLSEVRAGDRVVLLRRSPDEGGVLHESAEDLAVLAGAVVSEGWIWEAGAGFNHVDEEYFRRVVAAFDAIVGGPRHVCSRRVASGSVLLELDVQNLDPLRLSPLAETIGQRSRDKRVPGFVWQSSPAFKALFLRSLFEGDGSSSLAARPAILITYSTRSETLAREVQLLLLEFGVVSRLTHRSDGEVRVSITTLRDARLFAHRVGFLGRKQRKLEQELASVPRVSAARSSEHVPFVAEYTRSEGATRWEDRDWLARHDVDRIERWERDRESILSRITNDEVRRVIEPLVDGGYYYAEVASVEEAGYQPVYSVRVDAEDHAFVTNGFVSHNTEARLAPAAMELLRDIEAETVDVVPNYDGYEQEPTVLPARMPNLLANGAGGIAVGMATNIPPHNLAEVIDGVVAAIDRPGITPRELMKHIKGPDFPTGAIIMGTDGIKEAYQTGRGSIRVRGVTHVEEGSHGRLRIVVTELPYQVNKARLAEKIAELVREGKLRDVADLRDESNREGMRLVIELKRGANAQVVLNQLYKHTQLQENFGVIMLALVDGVPRILNLAEMVGHYVEHRIDVVTRRTRFELRKAEERDHIVQGLLVALQHLDEVIRIIRGARDADEARTKLTKRFKLTDLQANHILDMPLRRLTRLARAELEEEHKELLQRVRYLRGLLRDPKKIRGVVKEELLEVRRRFADARRTEIRADGGELDSLDLIAEEDVVITVSRAGYVKRLPVETYRRQGRGGKGVRGASLKEEDVISHVFTTTTHYWLLFFTSKGKVYRVKVHEIPEGSRTGRGVFAANLPGVQVSGDERVAAVIDLKEYADKRFLVFATRRGMVKKTPLPEYDSPRAGLTAINLRPGDELIDVLLTSGKDDLILVSRRGRAVRFRETAVRPMGRATAGVIGMRLEEGDDLLAMVAASRGEDLITVTEAGYGKRTPMKEFPRKGRGGKGVIAARLTPRTGLIAGAFAGSKGQDIFVFSSSGVVIRVPAADIRRVGRATQGVRTMRVEEGARVVAAAPVVTQAEEA